MLAFAKTAKFVWGGGLDNTPKFTTVVDAFIRGIPAVRCPVAELSVVHTLVPTEARHPTGATECGTPLFIAAVKTVRFSVTVPGPRDTLPTGGTAELIGPTSWRKGEVVERNAEH